MIKFWWIRHAPVIGNHNCCYGSNEVDCDVIYRKDFIKLAGYLPVKGKVFISPLSRAVKTYEAVLEEGFKIKKNIKDDRLIEQNLGDWTGMKYSKLEELTKELGIFNYNWLMDASYTPPKGESFLNLTIRVRSFLKKIIKNYSNENIIIFSHGGPIRAALSIALKYNIKEVVPIDIDNSSLTKINYNNGLWRVEMINI